MGNMRRVPRLLLVGAAVLAVSGCGSSHHATPATSPARIVQGDVSRTARAFAGWRRLPPAGPVCVDTRGGPPTARATRDYIYPSQQDYSNIPYMYPDRGDPHVTHFVSVGIANKTRVKFPNADAVLRRLALRAIRATG